MKVIATHLTRWTDVYNMALATEGKPSRDISPSSEWVAKILRAEHSPIRVKQYVIRFYDVPTYVFSHLTRHKHGVEWFIHSQRDDRRDNPTPRAQLPQGTLNDGVCVINAQALISISRVRLCNKASEETRYLWQLVKDAIQSIDKEMAKAMQPNCVYRGKCPEMKPCTK